jgi:hypothetical protein
MSLSSVTRRISTSFTLPRVPIISYPKDQYRSHTVTCPYHQLTEGSLPQSHCYVSLSSVTRGNSTSVTMWRVPIISYPKDQYFSHTLTFPYHQLPERSVPQSELWRVPIISDPNYQNRLHTLTCPCHQFHEGSILQSHCDMSLSSVSRRINSSVTLWRVPVISFTKNQYCSHTETCPYPHLSVGSVP